MARKSIADLIADDEPPQPPAIPRRAPEPAPAESRPDAEPEEAAQAPSPDVETSRLHDGVTPVRRDVTKPRGHDAMTSGSHDVETPRSQDATEARDRDVATPRKTTRPRTPARSRRGAPAAAEAVALTVRFDPDEYTEIDEWLLTLRRELGRTKLDKSEVVRALLQAARERADVRRALLSILKS
ncbi:hypothetical protein [Microbispora rosea]|uniref:hypothetical protein n=1 Tax=Microbispora rosea TaxID=58117 RepID=UPI0037B4CB3D